LIRRNTNLNKAVKNILEFLFDFDTQKKIAKALAYRTDIPFLTEKMEFEVYLRILNTIQDTLIKEHGGDDG